MKAIVHYALAEAGQLKASHVQLAISRYQKRGFKVIVYTPSTKGAVDGTGKGLGSLDFRKCLCPDPDPLFALAEALHYHFERYSDFGFVFTGSHALGPIAGYSPHHDEKNWAFALALIRSWSSSGRVPTPEYVKLPADLFSFGDVTAIRSSLQKSLEEKKRNSLYCALDHLLSAWRERLHICLPDVEGPSHPAIFRADELLERGAPAISAQLLEVDPLLHDINATNVPRALALLNRRDPELAHSVRQRYLRNMRLRDFNTLVGNYEVVIPRQGTAPDLRAAILIHLYYPDSLEELWPAIEAVPGKPTLLITTDTEEKSTTIRALLQAKGWPAARSEIRQVAVNRGRDMASLFISFREEMLSDRFDIALRLHSKRSPQVAPQVSRTFRDHLLENLAASRGHVTAIFDRFAQYPRLGVVIPPVIHKGFATLGHAWFNNKPGARRLARDMGLSPPIDEATPVAPYGTMYWFRPEALAPLFRWRWRWEHYNPEPHHVDGGLAHIQERMICLVAQDQGYETLTVMSPEQAAIGYASLEYKLQSLAAHMPDGNILHQLAWLQRPKAGTRWKLHAALAGLYRALGKKAPSLARPLAPFARRTSRWLIGS